MQYVNQDVNDDVNVTFKYKQMPICKEIVEDVINRIINACCNVSGKYYLSTSLT